MPGIGYGRTGAGDADVAVVRAVYAAFAARDFDAMAAHLHEDVEFLPQGTVEAVGRDRPYVGHAGMRAYFADVARGWDELSLDPADVRAAAGGVVVFGTIAGRRDGARVARRVAWNWRLRDGKVLAVRATDLGPA